MESRGDLHELSTELYSIASAGSSAEEPLEFEPSDDLSEVIHNSRIEYLIDSGLNMSYDRVEFWFGGFLEDKDLIKLTNDPKVKRATCGVLFVPAGITREFITGLDIPDGLRGKLNDAVADSITTDGEYRVMFSLFAYHSPEKNEFIIRTFLCGEDSDALYDLDLSAITSHYSNSNHEEKGTFERPPNFNFKTMIVTT